MMYTKIDWLSFTIRFTLDNDSGLNETFAAAVTAMDELSHDLRHILGFYGEGKATKGRTPYSHGYLMSDTKVQVYYRPNRNDILVELGGQACDIISASNNMPALLYIVRDTVTRIDIACDIECTTSPVAFAEDRDVKRFKAFSVAVSKSGETYYVGSRKSERYCRVYRYNDPHPRAKYLRVEYVVRDGSAKAIVDDLVLGGTDIIAAQFGNAYGWRHPSWVPAELTTQKPASHREERREGKTVFWLVDTIAPLLLRLHRDGVIELGEYIRDHIEAHFTIEEQARFDGGRT
jgi:hypothetical protein